MICYTEVQIIILTSCNICFIILHVYYIRGGDGMKIPKGLRVCYSIAADFAARFKADMLGTYAASAAFFIFVSLFPCFLLAVAILDLCGIAGWDVLYEFLAGAPRHVIDLLTSLMNEAENSGNMRIISIATLATLWAASRGVFALIEALGRIYSTRGETRPYIANRLLAILYTVAFILMMIIIIVLLIFGGKITAFLSENLPFFAELGWIVTFARYALGALLLVTFFTMLYTFFPARRTSPLRELPGAIIGTIGWLGFSAIYSRYIDSLANLTIYGSLASIVLLLLWLYFCLYIVLIGAEINKLMRSFFDS